MKNVWMAFVVIGWLGLQGVFSASGGEELFDIKSADEHFNNGLARYFQKDYAGAIEEFSEAIQINPENAKAYYFIGYSHYKQGEFSKASEAFEKAYELDTGYSPVRQPSPVPETLGQD